jgi:hypothetical protein
MVGEGESFVVRAEEKLTAFVELEAGEGVVSILRGIIPKSVTSLRNFWAIGDRIAYSTWRGPVSLLLNYWRENNE